MVLVYFILVRLCYIDEALRGRYLWYLCILYLFACVI
jgi:hypothetical protein